MHSEAQDGGSPDVSSLEDSDRFISEMESFETSVAVGLPKGRASCGYNDEIMKLWEAVNNLKLATTDTPSHGHEITTLRAQCKAQQEKSQPRLSFQSAVL